MKKLLISSSLLLLLAFVAVGQENDPDPTPRVENCELLGSSETGVVDASLVPSSIDCDPDTGEYIFDVNPGKYNVVDDYEDGCTDVTTPHTTTLIFAGTQEDEEGNTIALKLQEVSDDGTVRNEITVPVSLCCIKN